MIIARSLHEADTIDRSTWSASAIAPHRGDVTTVMAALAVRAREAERGTEGTAPLASGRTVSWPLAGWEGAASGGVSAFDLL